MCCADHSLSMGGSLGVGVRNPWTDEPGNVHGKTMDNTTHFTTKVSPSDEKDKREAMTLKKLASTVVPTDSFLRTVIWGFP